MKITMFLSLYFPRESGRYRFLRYHEIKILRGEVLIWHTAFLMAPKDQLYESGLNRQ